MSGSGHHGSNLSIIGGVLCLFWLLAIGGILWFAITDQKQSIYELAAVEARASFNKDLVYRRWAAGHGGTYVPATDATPPNPYLSHVVERDISTPSGRSLTLVNPAYMTRQVHELGESQYGVKGHITSLNPLRPENRPDPWEADALAAFEAGEQEVRSVSLINGMRYLRLMRPMTVEKGCLKCHAVQGYKEGELRGGISVSVPLAPYESIAGQNITRLIAGHGIIMGLGIVGLFVTFFYLNRMNEKQKRTAQALRESEARYRGVVEDTPVLICSFLPGGEISFVNDLYCEYFNKQKQELVGSSFLSLIPEEDRAAVMENISALNRSAPIQSHEHRVIAPDGEIGWQRWSNRAIFDDQGNIASYQAIGEDITQRKQAEQGLHAKLEFEGLLTEISTSFLNAAPGEMDRKMVHWIARLADFLDIGRLSIARYNEKENRFITRYQYTVPGHRQEISDLVIDERFPAYFGWMMSGEGCFFENLPDSLPREADAEKAYCEAEGMWSILAIPAFYEGQLFGNMAFVTFGPYPWTADLRKELHLVSGIFMGALIRRRVENAVRESEERYRAMMESMVDAAFICSVDYRLIYMNPAMIQRVGGSAMADPCYKIIHGLDTPCPWCEMDLIVEGKSTKTEIDSPLDHKTYHISSSPIVHGDGSVSKLSVYRDITERRKMERRLRQAQKLEAIGNLAGGIAHDFNNILYPIVGMSEMLMEDLAPESPEHQSAREILKAAKRAGDLVKQILSFSRQSAHKSIPVNVSSVLKEVLKLCRSTIPANINISQDIDFSCGLVKADPTQLHQIAMNLITNAYHAVEERDGSIDVRLKAIGLARGDDIDLQPGPYALLTVSDNGCGIDPADMGKIFEPYFTTKERGKGTGLGLATVYGIVKKYRGDIKVYSEPDKGSSFSVYLPLMETSSEVAALDRDTAIQAGTERILLVDDEASVVSLVTMMLERLGYDVTGFTASKDALTAFRADPDAYDLVISDVTMPGMTGDLLAVALRDIRPGIPIIICTGFSDRFSREMAEAIGINGFLMKPVVRSEMAGMIRQILDGA